MYVRDAVAVMHATSVLFYAAKEISDEKMAKSASPVFLGNWPCATMCSNVRQIVEGLFQHMSKCSAGNQHKKRVHRGKKKWALAKAILKGVVCSTSLAVSSIRAVVEPNSGK